MYWRKESTLQNCVLSHLVWQSTIEPELTGKLRSSFETIVASYSKQVQRLRWLWIWDWTWVPRTHSADVEGNFLGEDICWSNHSDEEVWKLNAASIMKVCLDMLKSLKQTVRLHKRKRCREKTRLWHAAVFEISEFKITNSLLYWLYWSLYWSIT